MTLIELKEVVDWCVKYSGNDNAKNCHVEFDFDNNMTYFKIVFHSGITDYILFSLGVSK